MLLAIKNTKINGASGTHRMERNKWNSYYIEMIYIVWFAQKNKNEKKSAHYEKTEQQEEREQVGRIKTVAINDETPN